MKTELEIQKDTVKWLRECYIYSEPRIEKNDIANHCGVTKQAVSRWFKTGKVSKQNLRGIANLFNKPLPIFLIDDGFDPRDITAFVNARLTHEPVEIKGNGDGINGGCTHVPLPVYRETQIEANMTEITIDQERKIMIPVEALGAIKNVDLAFMVELVGDSMAPVLLDGSSIAIDSSATNIVDGKIYAIDYDGMLLVRLLYRIAGGSIRMRCYNDEYSDELITKETQHKFKVLGRAFWCSMSL